MTRSIPTSEPTLREAFEYDFSRLDPLSPHIDPPSVAVYETLIAKSRDGAAEPMLARAWETAEDALEWRIYLRRGVRFHSGAPCDANAVVRSLSALRRGGLPGRDIWYWDPVDDVRAEGTDVLVFRLRHPYSRLPSLLWGTHTAIHNEALRETRTAEFGRTIADGTGPYRLSSWTPERVVASAHASCSGAATPALMGASPKHIEWLAMPDAAERLDSLDRGAVDCLHAPPADALSGLRSDPRFTVIEHVQSSNMYLALDWRRVELGFDDERVRRAISLAIDRTRLVAHGLLGHGVATYGPIARGCEFYDGAADEAGRHDPQHGCALLDEAGFDVGADGIRVREGTRLDFECVIQDDAVFHRVANELLLQLKNVGVALRPVAVKSFESFYATVSRGPAAALSKWLWQDPVDAIIGFSASSTRPFPNWQHAAAPELDGAYSSWLRAETSDELAVAAGDVQRVFARVLPYIPLVTPQDVWVHARYVRGWRPAQMTLYPPYHGVYLDCPPS